MRLSKLLWASLAIFSLQSSTSMAEIGQHSIPPRVKLTLLGTGGGAAFINPERAQPANLLTVDGRHYLVDAGEGVSQQLATAGVQPSSVSAVFLTHLHFDHIAGLASFLGFLWTSGHSAGVDVLGPHGTNEFVSAAIQYLREPLDLYARQLPPAPPIAALVKVQEFGEQGPQRIFADDRVSVSAVENTHFTTIPWKRRDMRARSYALRFDVGSRSIVFTGDTGPSDAVAQLAKGADMLVAEVLDIEGGAALLRQHFQGRPDQLAKTIDHVRKEHLSPEAVGQMAAQAGVKTVVLTHIGSARPGQTDYSRYTEGVRKFFHGEVVVGKDLASLDLTGRPD